MARDQTVAVLGAGGTMGFAMARNLARAGFSLRAWNRSRARAEPLTDDGALVLDSAAEALDGADVVLTMLSDGEAVLAAVDSSAPTGAGARARMAVARRRRLAEALGVAPQAFFDS